MTVDEIPVHETTRTRRRWGCTCGCLVIFIFLFLGFCGLMYHLFRPAPFQTNWLSPNVDGFGILSVNQNDDGMGELLALIIKRVQARAQQQTPEKERKVA